MNNFFAELSPKLTQDVLGVVVVGPQVLEQSDPHFFHLNFMLDGLLAQKGQNLSHLDTFLTLQFNHPLFLLYIDENKMNELDNALGNTLSMLKSEQQKRQKILVMSINQKVIPDTQKLEALLGARELSLVL